jgi:DNA invertase Pin-like site-specific DNA recombinase
VTDRDDTTQETPDAKRKRVFAYCRYSSEGQSRFSIEAQHDEILSRAQHEADWDITWWDEPARSAFVEDPKERPIWNAMMDAARAGECDAVVVYDVSRFSRRAYVALKAVNDIIAVGAQFISLTEASLDSTSMTGYDALGYAAVNAQAFSIKLGARARKGMEQRAKRGLHVAHPPFGYAVQDVRDGNRLPFVPDVREAITEDDLAGHPGNWAGLKQLHAYLLAGMTNQEAAEAMNAHGVWTFSIPSMSARAVRPFTKTAVNHIRHNVFYRPFTPNDDRGTVTINGVEYRGQHEAACTWDEWRTMQEVARSRRRGWTITRHMRSEGFEVEFRALLCCAECGARLWVNRVHQGTLEDGGERLVERYWCPAKQAGHACAAAGKFIYAEEMRRHWIDWLRSHPLPPDFEERVRQHVLFLAKHGRQGRDEPDATRVMREKDLWEQRRANAMTAFLDAKVDEREWRRRVKEADAAIKKLNHETRNAEQMTIRLLDAARIMTDAASAWEVMTTQERQMAAQLMVAEKGIRVELLGARGRYHRYQAVDERQPSGRIVSVTLRDPFRDLLAVMNGDLVSEGVAG